MRLPVQATGRPDGANAVVVVTLRRRCNGEGLSSHLCGLVFVFDVPKGRSPKLRDRPWHVLLLIIHPTLQRQTPWRGGRHHIQTSADTHTHVQKVCFCGVNMKMYCLRWRLSKCWCSLEIICVLFVLWLNKRCELESCSVWKLWLWLTEHDLLSVLERIKQ